MLTATEFRTLGENKTLSRRFYGEIPLTQEQRKALLDFLKNDAAQYLAQGHYIVKVEGVKEASVTNGTEWVYSYSLSHDDQELIDTETLELTFSVRQNANGCHYKVHPKIDGPSLNQEFCRDFEERTSSLDALLKKGDIAALKNLQ